MNCPHPELVGESVEGKQLASRVRALGKMWWDRKIGKFCCLADVEGMLCIISLKVTKDQVDVNLGG